MIVEAYNHEEHIVRLSEWLKRHGLFTPDKRLMSDTGLVVDKCAIGFLFKTTSKQAWIDHVAADPNAPVEKRDRALIVLFDALEALAVSSGCLMLTALAQLPTMKRRFESHGYAKYGDYSLYFKTL